MKYKNVFIFLGLAVVISAGFLVVLKRDTDYQLISPKIGPITEVIYGLGTAQSYNKFNFKSGVGNTIAAIFVQEGQLVKKGMPLLKFEGGLTVKSPMDGTVLSIPYNVGENVFADRMVISVEDVEHLYIECHLDQASALRVKKGMTARISFENLRNEVILGKVVLIYPSDGQFNAKIEVQSLPPEILPGMTADVAIEIATKEKAMLIPLKAVSNKVLTLMRAGEKQKVEIKAGIMDQEWIEDLSGQIQSTDQILIKK